MHTIHWIILSLALLLTAALFVTIRHTRRGQYFANALIVKITPKGRATRLADASFTRRYLLCKAGSDVNHIDICTASDKPLGVVPDATPTTDQAASDLTYPLPVNLLGLNEDTERMIASGVIALDALVVPDAAGKVKTLPTAAGTYWVVGRALTAAAADLDQIEIAPLFYAVKVGNNGVAAATWTVQNANNAIGTLNSTAVNPTKADFDALLAAAEKINDDLIALKVILDAAGITTT